MKSISIRNLYKTYRAKGCADVPALKGVSFTLPEKGMVFILGKSGCGKSTLLNVLGGLDNFDGGDVIIDGKSMKDFSAKDTDRHRNEKVGFVFQENNLLDEYTVGRNVGFAVELQSVKGGGDQVAAALKSVDLEGFADRKCNRLSGGQKQRVAIARAIVKKPEILLCDEPTGALDSDTGEEIFNLLKNISNNTLVIVVSHDRESAEKYGDRVIELKDGQVISDSAPIEVTPVESKPEVQKKSCGLPAKRAFSIGAGFLIARPVRLALCIIICLLTFTCVGVSDSFASYNREKAIADNLVKYKTPYYIFTQTSVYDLANLGVEFGYIKNIFNETEYERLKTLVKCDRYDKVNGFPINSINGSFYTIEELRVRHDKYDETLFFHGIVEFDESFVSDYGFTLYGEYPQSYDEIVIPDYMFEGFKTYGYTPKDGTAQTVSSYDDIIGKTLSHKHRAQLGEGNYEYEYWTYKIVGVLDTNVNKKVYDRVMYKEYDGNKYDAIGMADNAMTRYGLQEAMFTAKGFYQDYFVPKLQQINNYRETDDYIVSVVCPITGGKKAMLQAARIHERYHSELNAENRYDYFMLTGDAQEIVDYKDDTMDLCKTIFFYTALGTSVISALFVLYYVSGVVTEKKRQVGILRSLGASKGDIFKIFAAQNGIFAGGLIALATVFSAVTDVIINSYLTKGYVAKAVFLSFSIRQFAVLAAVAILAIAVGVIIPVMKILRAKPVDIISGRK